MCVGIDEIRDIALGQEMDVPRAGATLSGRHRRNRGEVVGFWETGCHRRQRQAWEVYGIGGSWFRYAGGGKWNWQRVLRLGLFPRSTWSEPASYRQACRSASNAVSGNKVPGYYRSARRRCHCGKRLLAPFGLHSNDRRSAGLEDHS